MLEQDVDQTTLSVSERDMLNEEEERWKIWFFMTGFHYTWVSDRWGFIIDKFAGDSCVNVVKLANCLFYFGEHFVEARGEEIKCSILFNKYFVKITWEYGDSDLVFEIIRKRAIEIKELSGIGCDFNEKEHSIFIYGKYKLLLFARCFYDLLTSLVPDHFAERNLGMPWVYCDPMEHGADKTISKLLLQTYNNYLAIYNVLREKPPKYFTKFNTAHQLSEATCKLIAEYAGPVPSSKDFIPEKQQMFLEDKKSSSKKRCIAKRGGVVC